MKKLSEDADLERATKEAAAKVVKEKAKAVDATKKKATTVEKARAPAKSRCTELLVK